MSNPEGDFKKMTRWHWATLAGIAVAVVLAGIAILVLSAWPDPGEPDFPEPPVDSSETVGVPPQALEPGEVPAMTEDAPPQDVTVEPTLPETGGR